MQGDSLFVSVVFVFICKYAGERNSTAVDTHVYIKDVLSHHVLLYDLTIKNLESIITLHCLYMTLI